MSHFFFFLAGVFMGALVLIVWSAFAQSAAYEDEHAADFVSPSQFKEDSK